MDYGAIFTSYALMMSTIPMPLEHKQNPSIYIDILCRENRLKEALSILQRSVCVDCSSYGSLFVACGNLKALRETKQVHTHMIASGAQNAVDAYTESKLLTAYAKCGSLSDAILVFSNIPTKNFFSWNAMIRAFSCHGSLTDVLEFVSHMQRQGVLPDNYTFPCILKACGALEAVDYGQEIHGFIVRSGLQSDVFAGNALLAGLCSEWVF
ncbi:hypothetical protein SUGI_0634630 [Cryptomeria japonica]|nr:hypothetical protein SUGI_0634630 [Cryptomeria japonica]